MKIKLNTIKTFFYVSGIFIVTALLKIAAIKNIDISVSTIPIFVAVFAFLFLMFVYHKSPSELYSQIYAYRKLKFWGVVLAFIFFEYVFVWGMHTKQLTLTNENFYFIIALFAGSVAFYFSFIRMKISLRYLFLGIIIPLVSIFLTIVFAKFAGYIDFMHTGNIAFKMVAMNTCYLISFNILFQLVCEEPIFRGMLTQQLSDLKFIRFIMLSSFIYAFWYMIIILNQNLSFYVILLNFSERLIRGALFTVLFVRGKNLLIPATCHGIITGIKKSIFAAPEYAGLNQYLIIKDSSTFTGILALWIMLLFIGTVIVMITPPKKRTRLVNGQ